MDLFGNKDDKNVYNKKEAMNRMNLVFSRKKQAKGQTSYKLNEFSVTKKIYGGTTVQV